MAPQGFVCAHIVCVFGGGIPPPLQSSRLVTSCVREIDVHCRKYNISCATNIWGLRRNSAFATITCRENKSPRHVESGKQIDHSRTRSSAERVYHTCGGRFVSKTALEPKNKYRVVFVREPCINIRRMKKNDEYDVDCQASTNKSVAAIRACITIVPPVSVS